MVAYFSLTYYNEEKRGNTMTTNSHLKNKEIKELFEAMSKIETADEFGAFFEDIATIQEIMDLASRLQVAKKLKAGQTYVEIEKTTGASATTIARVNKALLYGAGGYQVVLGRLENKK